MKLAQYLSKAKMSQTAFAQSMGTSQAVINRYVRNERFPDPETIERIFLATNRKVAVSDWYEQAAEFRASKAEQAA